MGRVRSSCRTWASLAFPCPQATKYIRRYPKQAQTLIVEPDILSNTLLSMLGSESSSHRLSCGHFFPDVPALWLERLKVVGPLKTCPAGGGTYAAAASETAPARLQLYHPSQYPSLPRP